MAAPFRRLNASAGAPASFEIIRGFRESDLKSAREGEPADAGDADADEALVARAKAGDERAFGQLVRRYQHRAVTIARALVPHPGDAEDIAQEAFLRAYRGLSRFRGASSFRTWFVQIVTNTARTHRRRQAGRRETPVEGGEHAPLETLAAPGDLEADAISRDRIVRALATLPDELREAVVLRDVEGLEYREIAEALGIPMGTVESRIFRARVRLRQALAGGGTGGADSGGGGTGGGGGGTGGGRDRP